MISTAKSIFDCAALVFSTSSATAASNGPISDISAIMAAILASASVSRLFKTFVRSLWVASCRCIASHASVVIVAAVIVS